MFTKSESETQLDGEINRLLLELKDTTDPAQYDATLNKVDRLQKMKTAETRSSPRVSPDTIIMAVTNLLGIVMILRYEQAGNFISSKGLSFVKSPR